MIANLTAVMRDGTIPAGTVPPYVPFRQDLGCPRGEDATIGITVYGQNRAIVNVTGWNATIAIRRNLGDAAPRVSRAGTIVSGPAGTMQFVLASAQTLALVEMRDYFYDIELVDGAGKRWQVVPSSSWTCGPIIAYPGDLGT